jgi:hypothetical protein
MKPRDLLIFAAIGAGVAWVLSRQLKAAAGAVLNFPASVGSAIGTGLYDLFHKDQTGILTSKTYIVLFPDGQKHAVDSYYVGSTGKFTYAGRAYQLMISKDGGGNLAVPL